MQSLSSKLASLKTQYNIPRISSLLLASVLLLVLAIGGTSRLAAPKTHTVSLSLGGNGAPASAPTTQSLSAITPAAGEEPFNASASPQAGTATAAINIKVPAANAGATAETTETPSLTQKEIKLGKGGTLIGVLVNKAGVSSHTAYEALTALKKVYDPRDLRPKDKIALLFNSKKGAAVFHSMKIIARDGSTVTVARDGTDGFKTSVQKAQLHPVVKEFSGDIGSSFYASARAKGVPARVIVSMTKLYAQTVDFKHGIKPSDRYKILYREYARDNGMVDKSKGADIIYADFTLDHQNMPLYRYKDAHGVVGYYDAHGRAAQKSIWRRPIHHSWISSPFGRRRDPITHRVGFHPGVDYAADKGTPIMAAGDGVIVARRWWGGYGRYIRIRHTRRLSTAYGHMSRFRSGLHVGSRVKQGEVIGYVGMTGHATGPHLHFEILVNNQHRNPLTVKLPHFGKSLHGRTLVAFKHHIHAVQDTYQMAARTTDGTIQLAMNTH